MMLTACELVSSQGEVLMELKTAFSVMVGRLSSWSPADCDPCGWEDISYSFPDPDQSLGAPEMRTVARDATGVGTAMKNMGLAWGAAHISSDCRCLRRHDSKALICLTASTNGVMD